MKFNTTRRTFALATAGIGFAMSMGGAAFAQNDAPVTLKWALWDLDKGAYFKPLMDAYKAKHPNVSLEPVDLGSQDYTQMISTQLTGGSKDIDIVTIKDVPGYASVHIPVGASTARRPPPSRSRATSRANSR